MSRTGSLTIKSSLGRLMPTSGDVTTTISSAVFALDNNNNGDRARFLLNEVGLVVLSQRSIEALKAIGELDGNILSDPDPVFVLITARNDLSRPALPGVGNPIQKRIHKMVDIAINLIPSFIQIYKDLIKDGYNHGQSLNKAVTMYRELFGENLKIMELIEPDVLILSYIQKNIQDETSAKELMSYLTYQ